MVKLSCKEVLHNVFLFTAPNQYHISSAFIRLQEFYESPLPGIRGNFFDLEDYMDIYADNNKDGEFSYFTDWNGFNVPGKTVMEFEKLFGGTLTAKEDYILSQVKRPLEARIPFYIIGVHEEGRQDTVIHEIAHALYTTNPAYKAAINTAIGDRFDEEFLQSMKEGLLELGYCEEVVQDETQAYLSTSSIPYLREHFPKVKFDWDKVGDVMEVFEEYHEEAQEKMKADP